MVRSQKKKHPNCALHVVKETLKKVVLAAAWWGEEKGRASKKKRRGGKNPPPFSFFSLHLSFPIK
jgi:hypothetical protein